MQTKYVSNTLEDWEVGTTVKWQKFLSIGAYILLMDRGWQRPKFTTIKKLFKKLQNVLLMFAINSIFFVVNLFFFPPTLVLIIEKYQGTIFLEISYWHKNFKDTLRKFLLLFFFFKFFYELENNHHHCLWVKETLIQLGEV